MDNPTSKTRSLDMAFVVDAALLRRLETSLREVGAPILEYAVKFSDGSTVKYYDIEEIITQPNSSKRSITAISASAQGRVAVYVVLRDNPSPSVEYTISGRQGDVIYFADQLEDWSSALSQWYSPFFSKLQIVPLAVALAMPLMAAHVLSVHFPVKGTAPQSLIPAAGLILAAIIEFWAFKLFPRGTFAVGQGVRRHDLFNLLRYTFVLSVLASVLANWVTKYL